MPLTSALFHMTRLWLRGGRWLVMWAALAALLWAYALAFRQDYPTPEELRRPHDMELRHLALSFATRGDLTPDFSRGVSAPLNDWLPHRTDGLVRPLWPWLSAWMMDDAEGKGGGDGISPRFATKIQMAKISFTVGMLALLGLACARAFSLPAALLTVFLIAFGVFLPSGRHFTPDLLFSVLFLLTWVCCIAALKRNSLWLYGMIGFFAALGNLTAPTTTPLLLVFAGVSTLRWLWGWILQHGSAGGTTLWVRRNHWLGMLVLVVTHLLTSGPMLAHAHQEFGDPSPFHWRWFDDAEEMRAWTATHGTPSSIRSLRGEEIPSFSNYRTTHSTQEIRSRLKGGAETLMRGVFTFGWAESLPRGCFALAVAGILLLLLALLWFVAPRAHHAGQALHPETAPIVLFTVLALVVCALDFGWDLSVLDFGRRSLALYAPLVLSLVWACEALVKRVRRRPIRFPVLLSYQALVTLYCVAGLWWLIVFLQQASFTA